MVVLIARCVAAGIISRDSIARFGVDVVKLTAAVVNFEIVDAFARASQGGGQSVDGHLNKIIVEDGLLQFWSRLLNLTDPGLRPQRVAREDERERELGTERRREEERGEDGRREDERMREEEGG